MTRLITIIAVGLLVLSILEGVFLWYPKLQTWLAVSEELRGKDEEVRLKEVYFADLRASSNRLTDYQEEMTKIESGLPIDPSLPALFDFMQGVSSENGLVLESMTAGGTKKSGSASQTESVKEIPFNIAVSGSYSAFKSFLRAIYSNARIIDIDSIGFSSPAKDEEEGGGGSDLFSFNISLKTYSHSPQQFDSLEGGIGGDSSAESFELDI